ncbi:hypothetical protein K432DRAFT_113061 [Lepidopterella palustris CBS 459.81]|uniref:Uncharacterized protein n=1 Tax=Lepidopterella palustris CBS 459.81 TaxID=1314670 RepID=A0A8E2E5S7_9PEZI|nr:hypothetical protein K432DRAFT_113061 [Lepidopterella palustris CBS 459.81]
MKSRTAVLLDYLAFTQSCHTPALRLTPSKKRDKHQDRFRYSPVFTKGRQELRICLIFLIKLLPFLTHPLM